MKNRISEICLFAAATALVSPSLADFPSASELATAEQKVRSAIVPMMEKVAGGGMTLKAAAEACENRAEHSMEAERLVYLRTAIILWSRAGDYRRASDLIMQVARQGSCNRLFGAMLDESGLRKPKAEKLPAMEKEAPAGDRRVLSGTQKEKVLKLKSGGEYSVRGVYSVSPGQRLVIPPGVRLLFSNGGELMVRGVIEAVGNRDSPIVLAGDATAGTEDKYHRDSWNGVKIYGSVGNRLEWVRISGAMTDLELESAQAEISHCELLRAEAGMRLKGGAADAASRIEDSLIARNGYGIVVLCATVGITNCMVVDNRQYGVWTGPSTFGSMHEFSRYQTYANVEMANSIVSRNDCGISVGGYAKKVKVGGCVIMDNRVDASCKAMEFADFTGNWWGATNTVELLSNGDGWRNDKITGGMMSVAGFLKEYPKSAGIRQ